MLTYEQRLAEFAHDKKLLRLPRSVRGRADAFCDACGSSQPRTLYSLKDLESQRYYFVGDTCLTKLAKSGYVLKRYGREPGQKVYESEMALRTQESEEAPPREEDFSGAAGHLGARLGPWPKMAPPPRHQMRSRSHQTSHGQSSLIRISPRSIWRCRGRKMDAET